jgi:hypothetical protein
MLRVATRSGAVSINVPSRSKTIVGLDILDRYPSFGSVASLDLSTTMDTENFGYSREVIEAR